MATHAHHHEEKVKVTFECTIDERSYIKMLAARDRVTISEFLLGHIRPEFPCEPTAETKAAMLDSRNKKNLGYAKSTKDFWEQMGINPNA